MGKMKNNFSALHSKHKYRLCFFASAFIFFFSSSFSAEPAKLNEIYIVPVLGHLDYGFTATQREVEALWPDIYRRGIELLENNPNARLVSDSILPLEWFHRTASDDEWKRFKSLVRSGRWEITAGLLHANTSSFSEAESYRLFTDSRRWAGELGVPIHNWIHADVPGLTWNMAEAATDAGIKFIAVGANEMNGLSPLPSRLPPLFYWQAPDGQKVLLSLHGGSGYLQGGLDLALHEIAGLDERLKKYSEKLVRAGYDRDIAMVLFSSGDNTGPEIFPKLIETVGRWNAQNREPKLTISTLNEFYAALHRDKSGRIDGRLKHVPTIRGDWPADKWESLSLKTPNAESAAREAKRKILSAQLISVISNDREGRARTNEAWRKILLYDEHSGVGAWPGKLSREQLLEQNNTEYILAVDALGAVDGYLRNAAKNGLPIICNPSASSRGGAVETTSGKKSELMIYRGVIPQWSCGEAPPASLEEMRFTMLSREMPVKIRVAEWLSDIFIIDLLSIRFVREPELNYAVEYSNAGKEEYFIRLKWGPLSAIPIANSTRALVIELNGELGPSWSRGGLVYKPDDNIAGASRTFINGAGSLAGPVTITISSLDGMQMISGGGNNWLAYVQEPAYSFRDGTSSVEPQEPAAFETPLSSRWHIKNIERDRGANNAINYLHAMPTALAIIDNSRISAGNNTILRSFSPTCAGALIEEIRWAENDDGIVILVRNISNKKLSCGLVSHIGAISAAYRIDGLDRNIAMLRHGEGWIDIQLNPLEVVGIKTTLKSENGN